MGRTSHDMWETPGRILRAFTSLRVYRNHPSPGCHQAKWVQTAKRPFGCEGSLGTLARAASPALVAAAGVQVVCVPLPLCLCPSVLVSLGLVPFYLEALFLLTAGHGTEAPAKTQDAS